MDSNNPHDKFFRDIFSRIEVVQDFCRHYLPQEILRLLDLSTLTLEKNSFIFNGAKIYSTAQSEEESSPDSTVPSGTGGAEE